MSDLRTVKLLGSGAFGKVFLVEDENGDEFALKKIDKAKIRQQPFLEEYLQDEISFMRQACQGPNIVGYKSHTQDDHYHYIKLEFCRGGDLTHLQLKQPNMAFSLKDAIPILAQVIRGLEQIHREGYIHRDLKLDNVLIQTEQDGSKTYKLADFGFTKKASDTQGTVLGTEYYMSPEVFSEEKYEYEVDMWAFGVLFFYMLNKEYPFPICHFAASPQAKHKKLVSLAKKFSYKNRVRNTAKSIKVNCTEEVEDLFKKMFELDPRKRINFVEIREHPLFRDQFGEVSQSTSRIYTDFASRKSEIVKIPLQKSAVRDCPSPSKITKPEFIRRLKKLEEINFLFYNEGFLMQEHSLSVDVRALMSYSYLRMHMILLSEAKPYILTSSNLKPEMLRNLEAQWDEVFNKSYGKFSQRKEYIRTIGAEQQEYETPTQFSERMQTWKKFEFLNADLSNTELKMTDSFLKVYYSSLMKGYEEIRNCKSDNVNELLLVTVIAFLYLKIVDRPKPLEKIFREFFETELLTVQGQFIEELRVWLRTLNTQKAIQYAAALYKQYADS